MNRFIRFSLLTLLAALAVLPPSAAEQQRADKRPNIVFIMTDDHAAQAISAYGSKLIQTPNIDRLAKEGMKFENCFVTNSICTPSRAAILTGKYAHLNGVPVFNHIDNSQPMLSKYLQAAGYHTGMVGKWHLGGNDPKRADEGKPTGFDYWNILPGQGAYFDPLMIENGERKKLSGYTTDIITDLSINFIKNRPADKPFFLMYHHKAPHRAWQPDEKHRKQYENYDPPIPATFDDDYKGKSDASRQATMHIDEDLNETDTKGKPPAGLTGAALKRWKFKRYMQDYLACVQSVDDNIGRFLDFLNKSGLAENTIVIYTSDQGFFLGEHNFFDKRFMYEESLRMPFLIRWPSKIKAGSVSKGMILNVDFAPMMLDAAGVKVPADMQGRSFLPLLAGRTPKDWRTSMYYRYYHPAHHNVAAHYGVRTERYKLIYFNKLNQWELYDLEKDPVEMKNVYSDPAYQKIVEQLKKELNRLRKELKDENQFADNLPKDDVG
ncbi:MAG TPA: sulfatase [Blastocatellia bacterium]|nr:sulfatase [Blastocatellia bacterium]HMY76375.1 sulfatase [Blastocatellia bacterium]HNG28806.1 sulfatase [Blastocatellia bacterium]